MTQKQMRCGTETKLFTRRRFLMKDMRLWGAILGLVIASWLLYPSVFAKRPPAVENDNVIGRPSPHWELQQPGCN